MWRKYNLLPTFGIKAFLLKTRKQRCCRFCLAAVLYCCSETTKNCCGVKKLLIKGLPVSTTNQQHWYIFIEDTVNRREECISC